MSDIQLARKIVQYFIRDTYCWRSEGKTLERLYRLDLASAFTWNNTQEGVAFWSTLYNTTLRTREDLCNFLKKNLILEDSNFIEIEFFL